MSAQNFCVVVYLFLPIPNGGAAAHLNGLSLPSIPLAATSGAKVDLRI
jgi:hypothetical protein